MSSPISIETPQEEPTPSSVTPAEAEIGQPARPVIGLPDPADTPDLPALRRQRQQQLLTDILAGGEARHAVLASAGVNALEFNVVLKKTALEATACAEDPFQRLQMLVPSMRLYGSLLKLGKELISGDSRGSGAD